MKRQKKNGKLLSHRSGSSGSPKEKRNTSGAVEILGRSRKERGVKKKKEDSKLAGPELQRKGKKNI